MGDDDFRIPLVARFAVTLFAAGYLIATRRRSRRAAFVGLCGVWLIGLWWLRVATGFHYVTLFRAVGLDNSLYRPGLVWIQFIHLAAANGLLAWAVLVDRPPPPSPSPDDD